MKKLAMYGVIVACVAGSAALAPAAVIFEQDDATSWTKGEFNSTGTVSGSNPVTIDELSTQYRVWAWTDADLGTLGDYTEEKVVWTFDLRSNGGQIAVLLAATDSAFDAGGAGPADGYLLGVVDHGDDGLTLALGSSTKGGKQIIDPLSSDTELIFDSGIPVPDANTVTVSAAVEYYTADDSWTLALSTSDGNSYTSPAPVVNSTYTGETLDFVGPYARQAGGWVQLEDLTVSAVPEPMTLGVLAAGAAVLIRRRRR